MKPMYLTHGMELLHEAMAFALALIVFTERRKIWKEITSIKFDIHFWHNGKDKNG